jgi:hypothetical protein
MVDANCSACPAWWVVMASLTAPWMARVRDGRPAVSWRSSSSAIRGRRAASMLPTDRVVAAAGTGVVTGGVAAARTSLLGAWTVAASASGRMGSAEADAGAVQRVEGPSAVGLMAGSGTRSPCASAAGIPGSMAADRGSAGSLSAGAGSV